MFFPSYCHFFAMAFITNTDFNSVVSQDLPGCQWVNLMYFYTMDVGTITAMYLLEMLIVTAIWEHIQVCGKYTQQFCIKSTFPTFRLALKRGCLFYGRAHVLFGTVIAV